MVAFVTFMRPEEDSGDHDGYASYGDSDFKMGDSADQIGQFGHECKFMRSANYGDPKTHDEESHAGHQWIDRLEGHMDTAVSCVFFGMLGFF